jgi:broad specificity phosphatase PhoE
MAPRIVLIAHAATAATRRGAFSLDEALDAAATLAPAPVRAVQYLSGPERRCTQTAAALGWTATTIDGFADLDAGRWSGLDLGELFAAETESVQSWMTDPAAAPHGGESLTDLIDRVGSVFDGRSWPDGRSIVVTSPLVTRAAIVRLLAAPPSMVFSVDIEPLSATVLTGHGGRWKLRALIPWGAWHTSGAL